MKIIALILFVVLMLPIYVAPWLAAFSAVGKDDETTPFWFSFWSSFWFLEVGCYLALFATVLVFARGARWTAALVAFAAVFDLLPLLDWIPLVPTVMLIIAFVFVAKA